MRQSPRHADPGGALHCPEHPALERLAASPKVPTGQQEQAADPAVLYRPGPQSPSHVSDVDPLMLYRPAGHNAHTATPLLFVLNCPGGPDTNKHRQSESFTARHKCAILLFQQGIILGP